MSQMVQIKHKFGETNPERIVILRALQLGDLMCTIPAFRALKAAFPESMITLIGLPWAREFAVRFKHLIDRFIEFPGFPGFPEMLPHIERFPRFISRIQAEHFDLAIQMQGSGEMSNSLVGLFGARMTAGYSVPTQYVPDPNRYMSYPDYEPEILRHLRLMEFLGVPSQGEELEFPLTLKDWEEFQDLQNELDLQSCGYAVIHPGARSPIKRYPAEWFAELGNNLVERGLRVVITGSPEETSLAVSVQQMMKRPAIVAAGRTSLGSYGALLSTSRLLICNDTGVSQVAAALKLPSVVLFTASDPARWAPLDTLRHRAVPWAASAMPEMVMEEIDSLLSMSTKDASGSTMPPRQTVDQSV